MEAASEYLKNGALCISFEDLESISCQFKSPKFDQETFFEQVKDMRNYEKAPIIDIFPQNNSYESTILRMVLCRLAILLNTSSSKQVETVSETVFSKLRKFYRKRYGNTDYMLSLLLAVSRAFIDPNPAALINAINSLNENEWGTPEIIPETSESFVCEGKKLLSNIWKSSAFKAGLKTLINEYFPSTISFEKYLSEEAFEKFFQNIVWVKGFCFFLI